MKTYSTEAIRNIALVGHQGSGKTMLAEAMMFNAGAINRMGQIEAGSTVSDYHPSEKERQMSIFSTLLSLEWNGRKLNVLDTPGYPDFAGDVVSALRAADSAVFVINAGDGVQLGTDLAWRYTTAAHAPSMFLVNQLDRSDVESFDEVVTQLQTRFGRGVTVVQIPGGSGTRSIIDVLIMKQIRFPEGEKPVVGEIDAAFKERAEQLHNELVENIAENDEDLMELYFEQGELTEEQMRKGLHASMTKQQLFPVFVSSATENIGVSRVMDFIANVLPAPNEIVPPPMDSGAVTFDASADPVAFVYRTMAEQHVGEYSFLKVYDGTLKSGLDLVNAQTGETTRVSQLYAISGQSRESVDSVQAGDLVAAVKLKSAHTNNTLHLKGSDVVVGDIDFMAPRYRMAISAAKAGEEDKVGSGLNQIHEEDPSIVIEHDGSLNQITVGGQGELHLKIVSYLLSKRFGVEVEYSAPKIHYRETVTRRGDASYRHKKQTGGSGQFADITLYVEPMKGEYAPPSDIKVRQTHSETTPWGSTVEFIDAIVGGVIDMRRFFGAIQKGIMEALSQGPVAGYPVGDVRVVVYDGGMHSVDSNEAAFKTASVMAFKQAFLEAKPVLLEPIHTVEVTMPEPYMGDVLGDLNTRRARILGMTADGGFQKIQAHVPEAEMHRYSTSLRSLTQGRGLHAAEFESYEPVPRNVQEQLMAGA